MILLIALAIGFVVGVIFVQTSQSRSVKPVIILTSIGLAVGIVFSAVRVVPAGHVGVVDLFGTVSDKALSSGIHLVNPLARVVPLSVRTQETMEMMPVPSREGLSIGLDISVLYRLDQAKAVEMYKTVGTGYREIMLIPQFRAAARGVTVGYDAKALYTSEREQLSQGVFDAMKNLVGERGIIIERILLRGMQLPPTVGGAIEQKLKAEQEAERMKFILQKEEQEAERKRVEAKGIRDAQTIISESLTAQYLHYLWINTLNQNPNVIYVATEANMPLFRTIEQGDQLSRKKTVEPKEQK